MDLYTKNPPIYRTVEQLLKKFDPLCEHPLRKNDKIRKKLEAAISDLKPLERHFRLSQTYLERERAITNNFNGALGKNWIRLIHDSKNPLVIGLGGEHGQMTTEQKRLLGTCSCVGTMIQYSDPHGGKPALKRFVSNLSLNTDKNAYATLQHLYHSLEQSPIKEIISNTAYTHLEVSFDNAPAYKSHEFLYGCTKVLSQKYPHLQVIRWVPLCPCHGKTDLDRRFSSFSS